MLSFPLFPSGFDSSPAPDESRGHQGTNEIPPHPGRKRQQPTSPQEDLRYAEIPTSADNWSPRVDNHTNDNTANSDVSSINHSPLDDNSQRHLDNGLVDNVLYQSCSVKNISDWEISTSTHNLAPRMDTFSRNIVSNSVPDDLIYSTCSTPNKDKLKNSCGK